MASVWQFQLMTIDDARNILANSPRVLDTLADRIRAQRCIDFHRRSETEKSTTTKPTTGTTTMPTQRESNLAPFFKFTQLGASVAGYVFQYSVNNNGPFIVMQPAIVTRGRDGSKERYPMVAVGLTTGLRTMISEKDKGRFLVISFKDTEPVAGQPSPRKVFDVWELTHAEMKEYAAPAGPNASTNPLNPPVGTPQAGGASEDADDDLPF